MAGDASAISCDTLPNLHAAAIPQQFGNITYVEISMRSLIVIIPLTAFLCGCQSEPVAQAKSHPSSVSTTPSTQELEVCEIVKKGFPASPSITRECSVVDTVPRAEGTSYWGWGIPVNVRQVDDKGAVHDNALNLGGVFLRGRDAKWRATIF